MKFLKRNLSSDGTFRLDTLVLPVPYNDKEHFLGVGMSAGENKLWGMVDFSDPGNKIAGIYTTGISYCCALSLIKKDASGTILKVWLLHLPGGLNESYLDELPHELLPEHIGTNQFELIVKFGTAEALPYDRPDDCQDKLDYYKKIITKKYPVASSQITMFDSENKNMSFAVHRNGTIGLAGKEFPYCGINGERVTHVVRCNIKQINENSYSNELDYFTQLIQIAPESSREKMNNILSKITELAKENKSTAAKGLYYTRNLLMLPTTEVDLHKYKANMRTLGLSWIKLAALVSATCFIDPVIYTIPKIHSFLVTKKQIAELINADKENINAKEKGPMSK